MIEWLQWLVIATVILADDLVHHWRECRPIRWSMHVLRVLRNTFWYSAIEKIRSTVPYPRALERIAIRVRSRTPPSEADAGE